MSAPLLPRPADLAEFERVRGDPAPWLPAMEAICARHGLDGEDLYAEPTGTNVVFRAGRGPWIKLFPPLWPEDFVRERVGLATITGVEGLATPQLLFEGELEEWPYVVFSDVPGRSVRSLWLDVSPADQAAIARQLGALMRRLHAIDTAGCAPIAEDWEAFMARRIETAPAANAADGAEASWLADLDDFLATQARAIAGPVEPVFLHADLTDDHVLVERDGGAWRVSGIIDLGDAMVGDALYDFGAPAKFLGQRRPHVQRALLRGYGYSEGEIRGGLLERLRASTLLHRFSTMTSLRRFCPEPTPRTLAELLEALWAAPAQSRGS